jgi:hypothetical protein
MTYIPLSMFAVSVFIGVDYSSAVSVVIIYAWAASERFVSTPK